MIDAGSFLIGCAAGASAVFFVAIFALGVGAWRTAWREGTVIQGDGIERNKRREQS